MITINPAGSTLRSNNVSFEKTPKQIIAEAPNRELREYIEWSTSTHAGQVVEDGIPELLKYSQRGEKQKQEVINALKDMIESKELQNAVINRNLFYGYQEIEEEYPGYLKAYERLTGQRLNVSI